ncbi:hypothetical protein [Acinetobacter tianfuensis]|nr:hypothetical protein [Acinetobacter tianfuensis]
MLKKILLVLLILFPAALYLYIVSNAEQPAQTPAQPEASHPQDQHQ